MMWIFTTFGFFSIVQHRKRTDDMLVRARVREHLVAFVKRLDDPVEIAETPEHDYPFRIVAPGWSVARALFDIVGEIDYPNFKDAAAKDLQRTSRTSKQFEQTRSLGRYVDALHRVWSVMREGIDARIVQRMR